MKQNERWLVYAVTGFLGLILVVAVVFRPNANQNAGAATPGLAQILNQEVAAKEADAPKGAAGEAAGDRSVAEASMAGVPAPIDVAPQPLSATAPKPMIAADVVAQQIGLSRRDRNVRFVRAKPNDSLEGLVRRWCGARDPYLAETKCLNEELVVLRVGQEVAVPWVDDEVLLAALEASKPKALTAEVAAAPAGAAAPASNPVAGNPVAGNPVAGNPVPAVAPSFALPGAAANAAAKPAVGAAGGTSYTIKAGDSLWRIAERTYGRKNADKMITAIKQANPGLGDGVREGQKIVLPAAPAAN